MRLPDEGGYLVAVCLAFTMGLSSARECGIDERCDDGSAPVAPSTPRIERQVTKDARSLAPPEKPESGASVKGF